MRGYIVCLLLFIPLASFDQSTDGLENFGKASFYHDMFHGRITSNGEVYDKDDFTAAHLTLPFNTILLVTNKKNNRSVVVRVNDRGPFKKSRVIDLSFAAAKKVGMVPFGVVQVKLRELNFLNPQLMSDDLLHSGDVWDCYGKKGELGNISIYLWKTNNWKHAFYMASVLLLDYKLSSMKVRVSGDGEQRHFELFADDISDMNQADSLKGLFVKDGFFNAAVKKKGS